MASGSDVKVTVTIEPEDARKLAAEVFELRERLKEAEDRAASWEALDAEAQIGADEVSRQLRDLKAELADVRAQAARQLDTERKLYERDQAAADLANVRARWAAERDAMVRDWLSDVGTLTAKLQTAEDEIRVLRNALEQKRNEAAQYFQERDAARAEAARYAEALANSDPWTNDVPFNCVYCDAVWDSDIGSSENQHNAGCVWIAAAALRGPAQSE